MGTENRPAGDPSGGPGRDSGGDGRSTKTLGRGFEEISHLFLSATEGTRGRENLAMEQPAARPATRAGVAVLRPGADLAKDQLTATFLECQDALESGMRTLGAGVSCSPYGEIDLLALDRFNQLTIVDVETSVGDGLLLRGISQVDWVMRNAANVRRMYQNWPFASSQPRLILVAPNFSPFLRSAVRQLTGLRVIG